MEDSDICSISSFVLSNCLSEFRQFPQQFWQTIRHKTEGSMSWKSLIQAMSFGSFLCLDQSWITCTVFLVFFLFFVFFSGVGGGGTEPALRLESTIIFSQSLILQSHSLRRIAELKTHVKWLQLFLIVLQISLILVQCLVLLRWECNGHKCDSRLGESS